MRTAILFFLLAVIFSGASGCAPTPYTLRIDGGYQAPVGSDPQHDGYLTGTVGGGGQLRNRHGRIALTTEAAARPAANGLLFALEGNLIGPRWRDHYRYNSGEGPLYMKISGGLTLVARVAAGPAFGEHRHLAEAALGVGIFNDAITHDHDNDARHPVRRYFSVMALEGFATRTAGDDHDDWMIGGRLSYTLPLNFVDEILDRRRSRPAPTWPGVWQGPPPGPPR